MDLLSLSRKVLFVFILINLFTVSSQEKYQSLLWKIEGNGLSKPSYLYGTMHVSSKIAFNLGDEFFEALSSADAVALETNPEVWLDFYRGEDLMEASKRVYNQRNYFSSNRFYENFTSIPRYDLERFQQFLGPQDRILNQLLYRFNYGEENYEETTYLDMFLFQSARKEGKPIFSLEDFMESFFLARRASLPDEDAKEENNFRNQRVSQGDLQTAYLERNLDLMDSMITENFSNNYRKYLLDIRNENMVEALDSLMPKMSVFSGVGAAHLAGEKGMIEMLREKGYTVSPVSFNKSSSASKTFNKIKKSSVDMPTSIVQSEDGRIELESVGKFYSEDMGRNMDLYQSHFLPDFANGAYYSYKRMVKVPYGENYREKGGLDYIDSILYLAIPGDISKQKSTSVGDYDAIEVTSELSRNRYLKQIIVDTPEEIIVFKASGNKSFIKSKNVKTYFKSIKIKPGSKATQLKPLGIQIDLPDNHIIAHQDKGSFLINGLTKNKNFFSFRSSYLKDFSELEEDRFELVYLVNSFAKEMEYEVTDTVLDLKNKTIKATLSKGDQTYFVFYHIYHNFYYQIIVENDKREAEKLINSFSRTTPDYSGYETIVENDTLLNLSFKSYFSSSIDSMLFTELKSLQDDFIMAENAEDSLNREFEGAFNTRLYEDPLTGEVVGLNHSVLNDYFSLELGLEEFKDRVQLKFSRDSLHYDTQILSEEETDTSFRIEYIYTKKGTDRVLHLLETVIGNEFITLSSNYDTTLSKSIFSKQIFESFKANACSPMDKYVLTSKAEKWLNDITSEEYQLKQQAKESIREVVFDSTHRARLERVLLNDSLEIFDEDLRLSLLSKYTYFFSEDSGYLDFLMRFYDQYKNEPAVQVATLNDIARIATDESTEKFISAIEENPPMTNDYYEIYSMFSIFEDSTHLLKPYLGRLESFAMEYEEFLPRVIYLVDRANLNGAFSTNDLSEDFIEKLEKRGKQSIRKISFSEKDENTYDELLEDMLELGSVLLCHTEAQKRFSDIHEKLDTISDKYFKANYLAKKINRNQSYKMEEIEAIMEDTTYLYPFFNWIDYKENVRDSILTELNPSKELLYHSYLVENGGYRIDVDSLKFHSKVNASTYGDSGEVYIYQSNTSYGSKNLVAVYFVDSEIHFTPSYELSTSTKMYEDIDIEEAIEELIQLVEYSNRVRVFNSYY